MKGTPKYEEILRLRRILDMEETAIMNIIFSFVHGVAIDNETYIDRLTGKYTNDENWISSNHLSLAQQKCVGKQDITANTF